MSILKELEGFMSDEGHEQVDEVVEFIKATMKKLNKTVFDDDILGAAMTRFGAEYLGDTDDLGSSLLDRVIIALRKLGIESKITY